MSRIEQYLKHMQANGTDMILETAASDYRITDTEYERLWDEADKIIREQRRRPKGISPVHRLRDRDVAKEELTQ